MGEFDWVFWVPPIALVTLLVILGIILLLQREPRRPPPSFRAFCPICKKSLTWLSDANRWYCETCIKYYSTSVDEESVRELHSPTEGAGTIVIPTNIENLQQELEKLKRNLNKLEDEKRKGTISERTYETLKAEYQSEIEKLMVKIEKAG
jgi:protein-arginine kinase activator protein McsA